MAYTVVVEKNVEELVWQVNELIKEGWQTTGGVIQTNDDYFAQAMVCKLIFMGDIDE